MMLRVVSSAGTSRAGTLRWQVRTPNPDHETRPARRSAALGHTSPRGASRFPAPLPPTPKSPHIQRETGGEPRHDPGVRAPAGRGGGGGSLERTRLATNLGKCPQSVESTPVPRAYTFRGPDRRWAFASEIAERGHGTRPTLGAPGTSWAGVGGTKTISFTTRTRSPLSIGLRKTGWGSSSFRSPTAATRPCSTTSCSCISQRPVPAPGAWTRDYARPESRASLIDHRQAAKRSPIARLGLCKVQHHDAIDSVWPACRRRGKTSYEQVDEANRRFFIGCDVLPRGHRLRRYASTGTSGGDRNAGRSPT